MLNPSCPPQVKGDAAELYSHFERFTESNVIGMTLEQSPVYRHILSSYRRTHPNTTLGGIPTEGGFPGYNSGVVLVDINKLRQSKIISECWWLLGLVGWCVYLLTLFLIFVNLFHSSFPTQEFYKVHPYRS